jgi:type III secretion system YscQ/HrcQ family protein
MSTDQSGQVELSEPGPLGVLPRLVRQQVRLEERLARLGAERGLRAALGWLESALEVRLDIGSADLVWRASGLLRPGLNAQLTWPSRQTRLGLGIETSIGHAIVDRLLGFERTDAEARRQLTPVEWGILTFVIARCLDELARTAGAPGLDDLVLDRVSADPFVPGDLGAMVTLRWPVRLGSSVGAVRLWIPAATLTAWLEALRAPGPEPGAASGVDVRFEKLAGSWRALAGAVTMPRGVGRLRVGGVLPIDDSPLAGPPESPGGPIRLVLELAGGDGRCWFLAEAVPLTGGGRLRIKSTLHRESIPREARSVNPSSEPPSSPADGGKPEAPMPAEIPVTLIVELGRVNLTLGRLADLKPGDVIELGRHSREPVELTSGGRLVARGELVQIDTELGVRVTHVFL